MYVLTVTHNIFFFITHQLHGQYPQSSLKILTCQLLHTNLHKAYYQMYIILLYPQYIVWY